MLDLAAIAELLAAHGTELARPVKTFDVGGRQLDFNRRRHLVGVINLSTDSWYTESVAASAEAAVALGLRLLEDGADIIDVGAESTLPEAEEKGIARQIEQLLPVVEPLVARGALVSVESYHPAVLEACAQAGAQIFNLTGMRESDEVFDVAARYEAAVVLCYVQGATVRDVGDFTFEDDMIPTLSKYFAAMLASAEARGVSRCFVDPGLGFYYKNLADSERRVSYQVDTFLNCFRLNHLGYPTFNILPHAPEFFGDADRRAAEPFFATLALMGGTHVIRTHEIRTVAKIRDLMASYERSAS